MIRVGLKNLVIAPLIKDNSAMMSESGEPEIVYGALKALPDVQSLELTASVQSVNVDADDATDTIDQCSGYSGTVTRSCFSPDDLSLILGEKKINGIVVSSNVDNAPYFAMGFKSVLQGKDANGKYLYMWILKTKFAQSNMSAQSKGNETLTPQPDAITFKSSSRQCDGEWRMYTMSNDPETDKTFFSLATLQMLATAASSTYAKPVSSVEFADALPATGEAGKIYVTAGTAASYWDGSKFVEF